MCPNDQVLSAYFDGELQGDWQTQVSKHVAECESCRQKLDSFQVLRNEMHDISLPAPSVTPQSLISTYVYRFSRDPFPRAWERKISVPFPVAVASMVLILAMGLGFLAQSLIRPNADGAMPVVESVDGESIEKLAELIEFLDSQDAVLEMRITLPADNNFAFSMGEPRLIKAANLQEAP